MQRTRDAARQAALALLVLDGSRPLTAEDEDAIATAAAVPRQLVIVNKTDLPAGVEPAALVQRFGQVYPLSAATGEGVDALCRAVEALYPAGKQAQGGFSPTPGRLTPWPAVWRLSAPPAGRWRTA